MNDFQTSCRKLARNERLKYSLITVAILGADIGGYFLWHAKTGGSWTAPPVFLFVLCLFLPVLFKLHKRIFETSWTGTVKSVSDPPDSMRSEYLSKSYAVPFLMKNRGFQIAVVKVLQDSEKEKFREIVLVGDEFALSESYYHVGDRVQKFAGLKYPVNLSSDRNEVFCPRCGSFNSFTDTKCYICKAPVIPMNRD